MSENKEKDQAKDSAQSQGNEGQDSQGAASPGADQVASASKKDKSNKKDAPKAEKQKLKVQLYIGKESLKPGAEIGEDHPHYAYCKGADLLE